MNFLDGITSLYNSLANKRNATKNNIITVDRVDYSEARAIMLTGIGAKILNVKTGYALRDTIKFNSKEDERLYNKYLAKKVRKACKGQLTFGRGIIVLASHRTDDLSSPLTSTIDIKKAIVKVFTGDMVTAVNIDMDLMSNRYMRPEYFVARGHSFHYTRVIEFNYVEPSEYDLPHYFYGGVGEFQLIREQLINDGIIERASASIVEKNSTIFYKVKGFKQLMQTGKESKLVEYFSAIEDNRSIYGAGLLDAEDDVQQITQALTNLADSNDTSIRRIAFVTGIPVPFLVGENVQGLNSTGDNERAILQDTISNYQDDFIIDPLNLLLSKFGITEVEFKENQGESGIAKVGYEKIALENAILLDGLGHDSREYLAEKDIIKVDKYKEVFEAPDEKDAEDFLTDLLGD